MKAQYHTSLHSVTAFTGYSDTISLECGIFSSYRRVPLSKFTHYRVDGQKLDGKKDRKRLFVYKLYT